MKKSSKRKRETRGLQARTLRGLLAPARGHRLGAAAGNPGVCGPASAPTARVGSLPKGEGTLAVGRVRHCPGQETGPLGSGRRAALPSGDPALPPPRGTTRAGPQVKGVPLLRQAVVALLLPHVAGAARPRAQAPAVTDRVAAPSSPAAPSRGPPRPDTSWKHRRQSPTANRKPPQEGQEGGGGAGGGGGSREPGAQGRKRGRGARRRESPAPHSRPPFPHRALQVLVKPPPPHTHTPPRPGRALAGRGRARGILPLNALSGKRQSRSEPRYLRSCARARPPALRLPAGRVT